MLMELIRQLESIVKSRFVRAHKHNTGNIDLCTHVTVCVDVSVCPSICLLTSALVVLANKDNPLDLRW